MVIEDVNWCKFIYIFASLSYLFVSVIQCFTTTGLIKLIRYGKLTISERKTILDVPKSYFQHFYKISAFLYAPIILYQVLLVYLWDKKPSSWFMGILDASCGHNRDASVSKSHTLIAIILLTLQIWRRFYDTHFVSVFSKKATMNIFQFIISLLFYLGVYLTILSEAPGFTHSITKGATTNEISIWDVVPIIIFLWSWYHQHTTTVILARLRTNKKGVIVTEEYKIPNDDWFKYLSSPHCTAEILMYTCLSIILYENKNWWPIYLLVMFNQIDSIIGSHKWYQTHFNNFPKDRKALIPYII